MINFLNFIEKDISAKKTLISSMPTKTKTNIKKFNENIDSIRDKYEEYRTSVRNYLLAKSHSFEVKDTKGDIDSFNEKVISLERVKFLLNPTNSYFEKMSFDELLFQLNNSYLFNFNSLSDVINHFLDKFEVVGVRLTSDDFHYTCYVHEYMSSFLEVRYSDTEDKKYAKVNEIFEQIYWINPELIEHIELNFRRLIREHEKKFIAYIAKRQKEVMAENDIKNYVHCQEKLKAAYIELNMENRESIADLIELAKTNAFDINQYLPGSKVRNGAYESLIASSVDIHNKANMDKICKALEKLKSNIMEFNNYNEFLPLFEDFKEQYQDLLTVDVKKYNGLKSVLDQILVKEKELDKLNSKIFGGRPGFFEFNNEKDLRKLKVQSVLKAKELYELYKQYDLEYFKTQVLTIISNTMTVADVLNLYYSFDYFKKIAIRRVYELEDYSEVMKYSDNFYLYATDPTNVIIAGIPIFEESAIARIIANKYRLNNIKITEDDLATPDTLLAKIHLILRVEKIENSKETDLDKIWFMVQVYKIVASEEKK